MSIEEKAAFDSQFGKHNPLQILIVDDNELNRELALAILEQLGYHADVAENGYEAVQAVKRQPCDVVLMDVEMPEMDGIEATRVIRRELETASQPSIIAMTAADIQDDRERCLKAGMNDYISKPIIVQQLIEALSRCLPLSKRGSSRPPDQTAERQAPGKGVRTGAADVLDLTAFDRLRATLGKQAKEMLPGLIDGFVGEAPRMIERARQALEKKNESELRREAHTLKSNAACFGVTALSEAARALEITAKNRALDGAEKLIERIKAEFAQAEEALQEVRKGM
ncbi:MAG: response regulator [bacterium]